jgi:hypothetical protein
MMSGIVLSLQRSLFAFDIIMALGRVTDVRWIREGKVYTGSYCTAQGTADGSQRFNLADLLQVFCNSWGKLDPQ